MDEIQNIKDCVSIARDKMIGEMLHILGENEAYRLVSKYEDYSRGLYLCSSNNEDGARKTSAEFLATMVRCCGDYWKDIFVAGTVIP